ncbi:MAG: cytochrome b [Alphaproteobacteria bacterium]
MWKLQTIILHWLTAVLIVGAIASIKMSSSVPIYEKSGYILAHVVMGITVAVIVVARLYYKFKYSKTNPKSNKLATAMHHGIYAFLIVVLSLGVVGGVKADLIPNLLQGNMNFDRNIFMGIHQNIAKLIIPITILHTLGAFYHLFKKGDHTFARMLGINKPD